MARLVEIVAPRSLWNAGLKSVTFLVLINAMDLIVKAGMGQPSLVLPVEIAITSSIALPFIGLVMTVLFHQRRLQHRLSVLATTDMLTGLPNRRAFIERARAALEGDGTGMLLLLDADHFKRINDNWGHSVGDMCLASIGRHLRGILGDDIIMGRLGGEEFAVFLPRATLEDAGGLAPALCHPILIKAEDVGGLYVTLSIGAAVGGAGTSLDRLMAQADSALYRAKAQGRARLEIWSGDGSAAAA